MIKRNLFSKGLAVVLGVTLAFGSLFGMNTCRTYAVTDEEAQSLEKGFDVSQFNGLVDFGKVKGQGYSYVMMRTGAGTAFVDPNFSLNYDGAGEAKLKRGVYYYSYATTVEEAKHEADQCLAILDGRKLECPVAYDIEEDSTFATGKTTEIALAFCEKIKNAGYEPMIYASLNKLNEFFDYDQISQYKIWVANYDVDYPDYAHPYWMWQHSVSSLPGANTGGGECDKNYIYNDFVEVDDVELDLTKLPLQLGEGQISAGTLTATILTEGASNRHINWRSEDESIATVDQEGNVTALANGSVNVIASSVNGVEASCQVIVTTPATGISFDEKKVVIGRKENITLQPTLTPDTSTDKTHYKSDNDKIVRVEKDGSLTGVKKGTATITATTDSGVSTKIKVEVKKAPGHISTGFFYKKMKVGESFTLNTKIPKKSASNYIEYYSRNTNLVTVSDKGKVEAVAEGWCLIKAETYNGKKSWKLIKVVS